MNKEGFLNDLKNALSGLPQQEIDDRISFYSEIIDDKIEEGMTEEQAIEDIGAIDEIRSQIISDIPITKLVKEKIKPKRTLKAWEVILIILGFPVWFPLLISFVVIIFSLYIVLWSLVICLWAIEISLWAIAIVGLVFTIINLIQGSFTNSLLLFGISLVSSGLSFFLFYACIAATKGTAKLAKKIVIGIKNIFVRKENSK